MRSPSKNQITGLLLAWNAGDKAALETLMPMVYDQLHRLARQYMGRERQGHTLQPTALVNEVYMRLVDASRISWQSRSHFIAICARMMRRILIDAARSHRYQKRDGGVNKGPLNEAMLVWSEPPADILSLDAALKELSKMDERASQVVEMRFFGGMTVNETAEVLHVSPETVLRDWKAAKAWLLRELSEEGRIAT